LKRGSLVIEASQTIASYWLPAFLARFRERYPPIELRLVVGNSETVSRAVLDGSAELGFVEGKVDHPALSTQVIAHDRLIIVVAPGHPWSDGRRIHAYQLADSAWILREPGSGTRSVFEAALLKHGIDPRALSVSLQLPSNEAVRAAVESGVGATAISESVAGLHLSAGRLIRVNFELAPRDFIMLRHKERYRSLASTAFEEILPP
jgi:DNA-binding transcriptional LysR family regulator